MLTLSSHASSHRPCLRHIAILSKKYNLLLRTSRNEGRRVGDDETQMITLSPCLRVTASITEHSSKCLPRAIGFRQTVAPIETSPGLGNALHVHLVGATAALCARLKTREESLSGLAEKPIYFCRDHSWRYPLNPNRRMPIRVML